jgi:carboxymethylenebutenolidase
MRDDHEDWLSNARDGMSRRQFLAAASATSATLAGFAVASNPVAGEVITTPTTGLTVADGTVTVGTFPVPIYTARPAADGRYPIVLVIPEVWGMHEHIKDITRRFAHAGYLATTFEPYAREGGTKQLPEQAQVMKVANSVPDAQAMTDLDAVLAAAKQLPVARTDRVGVTGFCRGGMYTLLYAAHNAEVKAAVPWYGPIKPQATPGIRTFGPLDVADKIHAAVLGLYGGADQGIPAADVKEMESALRKAGRTAEFVIYPEAPHAFNADYRASYRPEAAKDGWARCVAWFDKYLKG